MEIQITKHLNTPVFSVSSRSEIWKRVYGATEDKLNNRYLFPAFPPFMENVLHDLPLVYKGFTFSKDAQTWLNEIGTFDTRLEEAQNYESRSPFKAFEHQKQGLAELLFNYRWALRWEMGTAKTRVVLDALSVLRRKALVLSPLVGKDNWVDETELHTGGGLTALAWKQRGASGRSNLLSAMGDADICVVTYGAARNHGIPHFAPMTTDVFEKARQKRLAKEWVAGRKTKDVRLEVEELKAGRPQWFTDLPYEVIVLDESHRIKRIQSTQARIAIHLTAKAQRRYLLTGTLSQGDPRHLYTQLRAVAKFMVPEDWKQYESRYVVKSPYNDRITIGYKNLHVLNDRVNFVSSEKKLDDCVDLPERRDEDIYFDLSSQQRNDYNYAVTAAAIERPNSDPYELQHRAIQLMKLLQISSGFLYVPIETELCDDCPQVQTCVMNGVQPGQDECIHKGEPRAAIKETLRYSPNPKLQSLTEKLEDLHDNPDAKSIIWANFHPELDDIEAKLKKLKLPYVRVDGKTSQKVQEHARKFQSDPDCKVYLAQQKTGIAITLTAARYMFFYSRSWSLEDWLQARGRNFRVGQDKKTVVYRLIGRGSIEENQLVTLDQKIEVNKMLTSKINCYLCKNYEECTVNDIQPWTKRCLFTTNVKKEIVKAGLIHPKQ
jgi:SNF2 family DNA or RNA helicase